MVARHRRRHRRHRCHRLVSFEKQFSFWQMRLINGQEIMHFVYDILPTFPRLACVFSSDFHF